MHEILYRIKEENRNGLSCHYVQQKKECDFLKAQFQVNTLESGPLHVYLMFNEG